METPPPHASLGYKFAYALSVLIHPGVMPTLAFWLLIYQLEPLIRVSPQVKFPLVLLVFFGTFVIPILMLYFLKRAGVVSSITLQRRNERPLPFLLVGTFYAFFTYLFFVRTHFDRLLAYVLLGITISVFVSALITRFYKISMHSTGIGGLLGVLLALQLRYGEYLPMLRTYFLLAIVCAGLVMSARLYMKAHTTDQVWAGLLLSMTINSVILLI